jgi:hypothetical protein
MLLKRDPATIKLQGGGLDEFRIHARVDAVLGSFDPNDLGFGIAVFNNDGMIYSGFVPAGAFIPKGRRDGFRTRYRFKDKSARVLGENSMGGADGIFRASLRFRRVCKEPSMTAQIKIYGDFSSAVLETMTVQYYNVRDVGSVTAKWIRVPENPSRPLSGWKFKLANLPENDSGASCR